MTQEYTIIFKTIIRYSFVGTYIGLSVGVFLCSFILEQTQYNLFIIAFFSMILGGKLGIFIGSLVGVITYHYKDIITWALYWIKYCKASILNLSIITKFIYFTIFIIPIIIDDISLFNRLDNVIIIFCTFYLLKYYIYSYHIPIKLYSDSKTLNFLDNMLLGIKISAILSKFRLLLAFFIYVIVPDINITILIITIITSLGVLIRNLYLIKPNITKDFIISILIVIVITKFFEFSVNPFLWLLLAFSDFIPLFELLFSTADFVINPVKKVFHFIWSGLIYIKSNFNTYLTLNMEASNNNNPSPNGNGANPQGGSNPGQPSNPEGTQHLPNDSSNDNNRDRDRDRNRNRHRRKNRVRHQAIAEVDITGAPMRNTPMVQRIGNVDITGAPIRNVGGGTSNIFYDFDGNRRSRPEFPQFTRDNPPFRLISRHHTPVRSNLQLNGNWSLPQHYINDNILNINILVFIDSFGRNVCVACLNTDLTPLVLGGVNGQVFFDNRWLNAIFFDIDRRVHRTNFFPVLFNNDLVARYRRNGFIFFNHGNPITFQMIDQQRYGYVRDPRPVE